MPVTPCQLAVPATRASDPRAAAPAPVVVGVMLTGQIRFIDFSDLAIVVLQAVSGRAKRVHPLLWGIAIVFAIYFALEPIKILLDID